MSLPQLRASKLSDLTKDARQQNCNFKNTIFHPGKLQMA